MRKKDKLKIDVLSGIDDRFVDKVSVKRYSLLNRKKMPKWIIPSAAAAILVAIMIPVLLTLLVKQVPIYEGMTVLKNYNGTSTVSIEPEKRGNGFEFLSDKKDNNGNGNNADNGNHNGQNKKPVDEIIEDDPSITLEIPDQKMYYAEPGQDIYINVHISNPDSFEILSFTLNGKKYSSYMFEAGSDMENLILKVNVGDAKGVIEYTIDAIKYVDGTDIKDVVMEGDRTIKVGVYSAGIQPNSYVDNEIIGINDISFKITLQDSYKLIERSGGKIFAGVYTDDGIIAYKELLIGENEVSFDGLETNTSYRYAIVAYYDALDGNGMEVKVLSEKEFTTQSIVAIANTVVEQEKISFNIVFGKLFKSKKLSSMTLYRGEEKVKEFDVSGDVTEKTFTAANLLSNNEYRLVLAYENLGKAETVEFALKTLAKAEPTFTINDVTADLYTVSGSYGQTDADNTLISYSVKLFKGEELINENAGKKIEFDSLDYYTDYTVRITYTFDVNDGKGVQEKTVTYSIKTLPYIDIGSFDVRNTSAINYGDVIYVQADMVNPLNARITHVVINGIRCETSTMSTAQKVFAEFKYGEELEAGEIALAIESITLHLDGSSYDVSVSTDHSEKVYVIGTLEILDVDVVNEQGAPQYWRFSNEKIYVKVTVNNPSEYEIDEIRIYQSPTGQPAICCTSSKEEIVRVSNTEYIVEYYDSSLNTNCSDTISKVEISYHNQYASGTATIEQHGTLDIYVLVEPGEKHYISNASELMAMESYGYYELTTDIDLSGIKWVPKEFYGVLNGNGYAIKNLTFMGEVEYLQPVGLFAGLWGAVYDLKIENAFIMATGPNPEDCIAGGIMATDNDGIIANCTIDESSIISISNLSRTGGFVCGNRGKIVGCTNSATVNGYDAGGIAYWDWCFIEDCTNNGTVTGTNAAGIVVDRDYGTVKSCTNNGSVTGKHAAGISCWNKGNIIECINEGKISGNAENGVGAGICIWNHSTMYKCINNGAISAYDPYGIASTQCRDPRTGDIPKSGTAEECENNGEIIFIKQ